MHAGTVKEWILISDAFPTEHCRICDGNLSYCGPSITDVMILIKKGILYLRPFVTRVGVWIKDMVTLQGDSSFFYNNIVISA